MKYVILATLLFVGCSKSIEATVSAPPAPQCTIQNFATYNTITCGAQTVTVPNGISILGYIFPCGNEFANDEIFLRMSDGNVMALYDGGDLLSRLVLLAPGAYRTTDRAGVQCTINVDSQLNVVTSPTAATGLALNPLFAR